MVTNYISYFRSIAIAHKDIMHNPNSDTDTPMGEKHFTRIAIEEVVKGLQSTVYFPCLMLELYETEMLSENSISIRPRTSGAFMIVDHPADDSFKAQQECFEKTERIIFEILQKIYQDHKPGTDACSRPFKSFDFCKIFIMPVGPVFNGEYGYRLEFSFELQNQIDITAPPSPQTFII